MKKENEFTNDDYNALVHDYARVDSALGKGSLVSTFYSEASAFLADFAKRTARENGFDSDEFFNDVDDCQVTHGFYSYSCKLVFQPNDENSLQPILKELIRAFKNRAPVLGERFERVVEQNKRVACAAVAFLATEYLYLDRSATYQERERRNEEFRIAMFESHNDALYLAAFNAIRSYASAMARTSLAEDVKAAISSDED